MPNKTKIEWCDYTLNPVKGLCPMACEYCYARAMYKRFKWNPELRYDADWWRDIAVLRKESRIFVGSMIDLFHPATAKWNEDIFEYCRRLPWHTFIFLTKRPENLIKWSPFPDNCWIGISATNFKMYGQGIFYLAQVKASVKFISFEPLLNGILPKGFGPYITEYFSHDLREYTGVNWIIIGQQTPVRSSTMPKVEWIREIVDAADQVNIPVFLKDNLESVFIQDIDGKKLFLSPDWADDNGVLRQEFPKVPVSNSH